MLCGPGGKIDQFSEMSSKAGYGKASLHRSAGAENEDEMFLWRGGGRGEEFIDKAGRNGVAKRAGTS